MKKLTTNILTWENIQNQSSYSASAVSLSGSYGSNSPSKNPDNATFRESALGQAFANSASSSSPGFTPGLPAHESGGDGSTTYATISAGRLNIGGKDTSVEELGIHSNPESAHRQIEALPDLQQLMQNQQTVAQSTATIASAVRTFSGNMAQKAAREKAQAEADYAGRLKANSDGSYERFIAKDADGRYQEMLANSSSYAEADTQAKNWGIGGSNSRALNAVSTIITGALGGQSSLQTATNALAPYAAETIGQTFGQNGSNPNQAAQLLSHAILAGVVAATNGGDFGTGALSAAGAEAAAKAITTGLYGQEAAADPNRLSEEQKDTIRSLSSAVGAFIGGVGSDNAVNVSMVT